MEITVLYFGQICEVIGNSSLKISDINDTNVLIEKLELQFPALKNFQYSIAVNHKIIQENTKLNNKDIVALLPPFSGG